MVIKSDCILSMIFDWYSVSEQFRHFDKALQRVLVMSSSLIIVNWSTRHQKSKLATIYGNAVNRASELIIFIVNLRLFFMTISPADDMT